jgi:cytochrome P450
MQFALYEVRLVLGMLLRRFEILPVDGSEVGTCAAGTLRPDRALNVIVKPRQ